MKKLVLCCLLAIGAWAACGREAEIYEDCIKAYTEGYGWCPKDNGSNDSSYGRNVTAEMVNRARLKLDACLARQMQRRY